MNMIDCRHWVEGSTCRAAIGARRGGNDIANSGIRCYTHDMTQLMEKAIEKLREVPEAQQDRLARFLLNELEEDDRWLRSTVKHEGQLERLVGEVLADDARGNCEPLDPDRL